MGTASFRFVKSGIAALICPDGKPEAFFWDTTLPGFGLRAYASGRRQWIAQYRDGSSRTRRATVGDVKKVELDEARRAARKLLSRVELGADPQAEKQAARAAVRVSTLVATYLAEAEQRLKPRSFQEVKRHLRVHAKPLHQDVAARVTRADIAKVLAAVATDSGPVAANRVRSSLSAMWAWGLASGTIDGENPVAHVRKPGTEAPRDRVLTDAELTLIWQATGRDHDHDRIVRLLMLTGARREEVGGMMWAEVDGELWTLPRGRSKNGLPHEVLLGALALAQLPVERAGRALIFGSGAGGFSGWSRCKERLDVRLAELRRKRFHEWHGRDPLPNELLPMDWTLHDLRRTLSTWLSEFGTDPHIVEAVLGHVSGAAKRGVAGVYNKATYRAPKRAALARWECHVRQLAGLPADIVGAVTA
jgi:integrase